MHHRHVLFPTLILLFALTFAACGTTAVLDSPAELAGELHTSLSFSTELFSVEPSLAETLYPIVPGYASLTAYAAAGDAADLVLVIKATDEDAAKTQLTKLEEYMVSLEKLYASYAADQCPRIRSALLTRVGDAVVFCISNDTDAAKSIVEAHTK